MLLKIWRVSSNIPLFILDKSDFFPFYPGRRTHALRCESILLAVYQIFSKTQLLALLTESIRVQSGNRNRISNLNREILT